MTFAELLNYFDREMIGEEVTLPSSFGDDTRRRLYLYHASVEIAAALGFPKAIHSGIVASANTFYEPPVVLSLVGIEGTLLFGEFDLQSMPLRQVLAERALRGSPIPKYFNYDAKRGSRIELSGSFPADTPIQFEFIQGLDPLALSPGTEVWNGIAPDFHWVVAVRAAARLWSSTAELFGTANYYLKEYNNAVVILASRMGRTDIGNILLAQTMQGGLPAQDVTQAQGQGVEG